MQWILQSWFIPEAARMSSGAWRFSVSGFSQSRREALAPCRQNPGTDPGRILQSAHLCDVSLRTAEAASRMPRASSTHTSVYGLPRLSGLAVDVDPALLDLTPQMPPEFLADRHAENLGVRVRTEPAKLLTMPAIAGQPFCRYDPVRRRSGREPAARQQDARAVKPERTDGGAGPERLSPLRAQRLHESRNRAVRRRQIRALDEQRRRSAGLAFHVEAPKQEEELP